ncbi:MAG: hypothetical protein HFJ41_01500 [Clostridia bacterium]|nr:hypothetical protein [Clostridia bacterium]
MFEKIKNILKRLFKKQSLLEEGILKTEVKQTNFKQELIENTAIYNTQKMYDEGKITEDDMQISEIRKLISVYKEQINILDREIIAKKEKYNK